MPKTAFICVANWKMQFSCNKAIQFCNDNLSGLTHLGTEAHIIICPSSTALYPIAQMLRSTSIDLGAQNCSCYPSGAHTGEESAQSLAEIGCSYCIIGHSERRTMGETNTEIAAKAVRLFEQNITPIICVGETQDEHKNNQTLTLLEQQLTPIATALANYGAKQKSLLIAYEPVWAIGSGTVPTGEELQVVFDWLAHYCKGHFLHLECKLLYGGSVQAAMIPCIKSLPKINGLLIGGASLDFQNFKNIVSLVVK